MSLPKCISKACRTGGWILALLCSISLHAAEENSSFHELPIDPELAIKQFKVPEGFKINLFAAEPELANPVAFCFDEKGRIYVAETYRYKTSVYDIRDHLNMYYDDLASRTVGDRVSMIQQFLGSRAPELANESEVVQMLEDRAGTGRADRSIVFAAGFNSILDGIGSGVLARKGKVFYTDIPNLWALDATNASGLAGARTSLSFGYGVHFGYTGHDLHGLRMGPDGKLYFSIGDRGLHVRTQEGNELDYSETGSVLRCNPDGSELEVFAYGLRNPQELAFDDRGNLFTGDNNCDHGDAARIVYVVEGSDSGWRIANQFSETTEAGVWNSEKMWHLQFPEQAAYIIPPIAHLGDGPSGFTHYPGTGFPAAYQDHFFLCDFRGASVNSGVHSFAMNPKGASFDVVDRSQFFWHVLCTDAEFSPDGQLFVTDWVRGWNQSGVGRIYRVANPELANSPLVLETKKIIADGMTKRPVTELETLLGHADQRVRQEAQFELAERGLGVSGTTADAKSTEALTRVALKNANPLARLHGIWGVGQIGRASNAVMSALVPLLTDSDAEVRAQTAKVMGDAKCAGALAGLTNLLADENLHVRLLAAISLGKLADKAAVAPLLEMLRVNADKDVFLRHAGVMGLLGTVDKATLREASKDSSRSVRMAVLLVMRRMQSPEMAAFLHDRDSLIVLEAARAINDLPIREALPHLAALIDGPAGAEPLDWRVVNANVRVGNDKNATALVTYAGRADAPERMRSEALRGLATWAKPFPRDRVTGLWRPLPVRNRSVAVDALQPTLKQLAGTGPDAVRLMAVLAVRELKMTNAASILVSAAEDTNALATLRVTALKGLADFGDGHVPEVIQMAMMDKDENVRVAGTRLQAQLHPDDALAPLAAVLEHGTLLERQSALTTLGAMEGEGVDKLLGQWMDRLIAGKVDKEIQFDVLQAGGSRSAESLRTKFKQYQDSRAKNDDLEGFRELLYGGDAAAGKRIFEHRADVACVRCHKIDGAGGEVGPDLTGISKRHDRAYILESILLPNKQIAAGFESVLVEMNAGQTYAGILRNQDDQELTLFSIEDNALVKLKKKDIKSQIKGQSPMPEGLARILTKQDLRNLVEFLAATK